VGTRHAYDICVRSTQLHGILRQEEHTQERQGPCQSTPVHVFHLNTGCCLLRVSDKQLCLRDPGMAHTTQHFMEDRQARVGCPPEGGGKTDTPILKEKETMPYPIDFMLATWHFLDLSTLLGASVFACLATGHIREFTVQRLNGFDPNVHVSWAQVSFDQNREGQKVTVLHVPHTKVSQQGEDVCLVFASSVQSGFLPPKRATVDRNRSRTDPHIAGTEPDHLGPVYFGPWDRFKPVFFGKIHCTNINHFYLNYNYSEN
jgi:hypothetical protein